VCNYDIIVLSETWTNRNDPYCLDITGYVCEHVYGRKFVSKRGRYSGGVSVYYRSHLKDHILVIEKCENNMIWVKLSACLFDFDCDVVIGGVYIIPDDNVSKSLRRDDTDSFELIEQGIAKYDDSKLIVVGDFNSRTGTLSDDLEILRPDRYVDTTCVSDVNIDRRVSQDHVTDTRGRRLLDLCKSTGLVLANGRLCSDKNVGQLTFAGPRGCSVVDYCLLRAGDCTHLTEFNVHPFNALSDHAPISLSIGCLEPSVVDNSNVTNTDNCVNKKIVWDDAKADAFRRDIVDNKQCLDSLTNSLVACNNDECISTIVSDFSEFVFTYAFHNCGVSYKHGNHRTKFNRKSTNTWFNGECAMARNDFCKLGMHFYDTSLV
jgi:hypothetical protein